MTEFSITKGIVSSNIYDKQDDFNFERINLQFLDGNIFRSLSYGVYILFVLQGYVQQQKPILTA